MAGQILIYGATGYTGKLIVKLAGDSGDDLILAGRNAEKVEALAGTAGCRWRAFGLEDSTAVDAGLQDVDVVLHVAGPFSATSEPMVEACLRTKTHYLDITGEVDVFEALFLRDSVAKERDITILPGVGFDVVPSDCLAAHVSSRAQSPQTLRIGLTGSGAFSRGTMKTGMQNVNLGTLVRKDGVITRIGQRRHHLDYGSGLSESVCVTWGDVATAYYSTGINNIEVYFKSTPDVKRLRRVMKLGWLLAMAPMQRLMMAQIDRGPEGPTDEQRAAAGSTIVAEVENTDGTRATSRLTTPEAYTLTALAALSAARRVAGVDSPPGFQTPSTAFGADFVLGFEGVRREDLQS